MLKRTGAARSISTAVIEAMEARRLLSAAIDSNGVLQVEGTVDDDVITVELNPSDSAQVHVVVNGVSEGAFNIVSMTGGMRINGGKGDDDIRVGQTSVVTVNATLIGGKGDDTLMGGAGDDILSGGTGTDTMDGGAGADTILGGNGRDDMHGGDGNDDMNGGNGGDTIDGDDDDDFIRGKNGADDISGGTGNDEIHGGNGRDDVSGDDGDDDLFGNNGRDALNGGEGDDDCNGGHGNDDISGGNGSDRFRHSEDDEVEDRGIEDSEDEEIRADEVPAAVTSAFNEAFPGATIREIERETEDSGLVYEFRFSTAEGNRGRAEFDSAGNLLDQEIRD